MLSTFGSLHGFPFETEFLSLEKRHEKFQKDNLNFWHGVDFPDSLCESSLGHLADMIYELTK